MQKNVTLHGLHPRSSEGSQPYSALGQILILIPSCPGMERSLGLETRSSRNHTFCTGLVPRLRTWLCISYHELAKLVMRVPLPSRTSSEVVVASLRGGHAPWKRFYPLIESLRPLHSNDIGMWSTVTRRPAFVRSQSQCIRNRMTSSYPPRGRFHWMSPSVPKFEPSTGMVANLLAISCRCFHPVLGSFSEHRKLVSS